MTISQLGAINTTALIVPDVYVQIVPPQTALANGVPTDILGVVGTASWGPVNSPTTVSTMQDYAAAFGGINARKYDMGTAVAAAVLQGASNFRCVRVTDGTDAAATVTLYSGVPTLVGAGSGYAVNETITMANGAVIKVLTVTGGAVATFSIQKQPTANTAGTIAQVSTSGSGTGATFSFAYTAAITLTSKYTGTLGNSIQVTIDQGSSYTSTTPTYKLTVGLPGQTPEVFDNIGGTGATFWANVVAAVNLGQSGLRGPSQIIVATAGTSTVVPWLGTNTLAGGNDGATTITSSVLLGVDTSPRKGMYALRSVGASVGMLADVDDSTTFSAQIAFGLAEGVYMIGTGPAGETITSAIAAKQTAGIDSYAFKQLLGDWCYFNDVANGVVRLISPQGFVAGRLANLGPQESSLNKPIYGLLGTQKTYANQVYSTAELTQLGAAGIDVLTSPSPGGFYFAARFGHNTSSNSVTNGDAYTRMTNYLAATFNGGMGFAIGKPQTPTLQRQTKGNLDAFLANLRDQTMIADWQVVLDSTNNPPAQVAKGFMRADVTVQYLSTIEKFLINLQGGQTVQIQRTATQLAG